MRGITALAVLALVGPVFAQGERAGPDRRPGPDARRGAGIEQKLEEILHRLERLERRVEERDGDQRRPDRMRRHDRDERSPRRGPAPRDGSRRGNRPADRPDARPHRDQAGPDAAPVAQFRRLMQAAKQGDPRARKMLEHMYEAIGQMLGKGKQAQKQKTKATKTARWTTIEPKSAEEIEAIKVAKLAPGAYELRLSEVKAADRRRAAALRLMNPEAEIQVRMADEQRKVEEMQRAARIAELRAQSVRLQHEIEQLRRELAK